MDKNVLMNLLYINLILPVAIMIAFIMAHNRVIKTNNHLLFLGLESIAILVGVVLTFFGAYTALSAFGPGAALCSESFIMGIITAFILFAGRFLKQERGALDNRMGVHGITLKLVLVLAQLMPVIGSYAFYNACDSLHRQMARPLVLAVETYYGNNNEYPNSLEILVPKYISEIPTPICLQPYSWMKIVEPEKFSSPGFDIRYSMLICGNKKLLAVPATILGFVQRYDFLDQTWTSADSLDGYCSDIE